MSIQQPRGSLLKRTQLSSLTKFRSQLQSEQQQTQTVLSTNRGRNRINNNDNNDNNRGRNMKNRNRKRKRGNENNNNNNNNKENVRINARTRSRSNSRTRNNSYQKPMNFNEMKAKIKIYRKQLSEINEVNDRLNEEKEDLEDELKIIDQRYSFETEEKDRRINDLSKHKSRIETENNSHKQKVLHLQDTISMKQSEIEALSSAKRMMEQEIARLTQSISMKDHVLQNNQRQISMIESENKMIKFESHKKDEQIKSLTHNLHQLQNENQSICVEIKNLRSENMTISLKNTSLNNMNSKQLNKLRELNEIISKNKQEMAFMNERMQRMQQEKHALNQEKQILERENESQSQRINEQSHELNELQSKCRWFQQKSHRDEEVRKRLHNEIQELKGNIRVFCRVRPVLENGCGSHSHSHSVYEFENHDIEHQSVTLLTPTTRSGISGQQMEGKKYNFDFDRVFRPFANQEIVFCEISQLVQSALDGYKVCIFAYGQTGSGKTYTMEGASLNKQDEKRGIIPRSVEKIFEHKHKLRQKGWNYKCCATYLEIYNEKIRDLLVRNEQQIRYLEIRQKKSKDIYVEGLTEIKVESSSDVYPLLKLASRNRSVGRTDCNERSSRSHSVFQLFLNGYNEITSQSTFGVLNLIDLAGSERLKKSNSTGIHLKETQNINKSLSCLGDVISALSSKKNRSHIPYRNSKLTYLLMNYFGGDAKTLMFVNLCPENDRIDESLCSLRFAAKANDCHIGIAKRNIAN